MKQTKTVFQCILQMKYCKKYDKFRAKMIPSIFVYRNRKFENLKIIEDEYNLKNE